MIELPWLPGVTGSSAEKPVLDHPIMLIALRSVGEDDLGNAEDGGEYFV